jgi:large subunit ribosomal protein L25
MERKLRAERRDGTGKGASRKIRAAGRVPAVVYGRGSEPLHVSVDQKELIHLLHTEAGMNVLVEMRVDGERFLAMPREVQRDHVKGRFLHVDFLRIARDEKVTVEVPIHLVGESRGVKEGGVVEHHLWSVSVESLPQDVPAAIEADITGVGIGESLKVADLRPPKGCTILAPPEEVVVSVVPPQVLRVEEEAAPAEAAGAASAETQPPEAAEGAGSES